MLHHRLRARLLIEIAEWILSGGTWQDSNRWLDSESWVD